MLVCFLRHGKADPRSKPDEQRQLLDEGRQQLQSAASTRRRLGSGHTSSSARHGKRSIDSARLFMEGIGIDLEPTIADELAPGATWGVFAALLARQPSDATVVFVGHEPDMSDAAEGITGSHAIRLMEGGLCCVEVEDGRRSGSGVLTVLLDPALYNEQS